MHQLVLHPQPLPKGLHRMHVKFNRGSSVPQSYTV
jgi:hypothetical protein